MRGFYYIAFTEYMFVWKTLLDYTNSFSPNDYKKNVFIFAVSVCVSLSAFALLVGVPAVITSSVVVLKICAITAGIKSLSQLSRERGKTMIK